MEQVRRFITFVQVCRGYIAGTDDVRTSFELSTDDVEIPGCVPISSAKIFDSLN